MEVKRDTTIAVIQLDCKIGRESANMRRAERYITQAAKGGADLICLPEAFLTSGNMLEVASIATSIPGPCTERLREMAGDFKVHIVAGLLEADAGRYFSTSFLISPQGTLLGTYRRVHGHELERRYISMGTSFSVMNTELGRIGLIQGYDLNFPEACRELYRQDVDIIVCSALIPEQYAYVARQLLLARAIEAQSYLVFASGVGANAFAGFAYMGDSQVVGDPLFLEQEAFDFVDGDERMGVLTREEGLSLVPVRVGRLRRYRAKSSLLADLQPASYWQDLPLLAS